MKKTYYKQVNAKADFPDIEKKILEYWEKNNVFETSVDIRPSLKDGVNNEFIFYDGPPFANGLPHYGHLLTGYIKDLYARYQTIKGKKVERRFGWDCHGLPAEMQSQKDLNVSGRKDILEYGIDNFNSYCKSSVLQYTSEWKKYVNRQARWVDFKNDYKTMDKNFMESVLWSFKELYKKGYIYKAQKVVPYSWACQTALSNFETRLDNSYRQRADKAVTVCFQINNLPDFLDSHNFKKSFLVAWTTTPWTLPSNLALAINPKINYVALEKDGFCYIVADFAKAKYTQELGVNVVANFKGTRISSINYKPLFDYFLDHKNAFTVLSADFVIEGEGTGIVHVAPGFGEDDQILCSKNNISLVCPVDEDGKFTREIIDFEGMQVFDTNDSIIIYLKNQGNWIKTEQYLHNYPHCWRTDTPLIYKAVSSWYVRVTDFKDKMIELNKNINWIPGHVKDGLFGKWLENSRDWAISRHRFWGTPLPVWESDDPKYPRIDIYGSIAEIEKDFGTIVEDLHRPFIDSLVRPNPDDPTGKSMMRRIEDVFDCWFESGSMPYAQVHYPFENKKWFEEHFPADFIVEYTAQTRGWFYTLMVLSTALFERPPFLNCICHGVILDTTGQKLSKRLNNYPDPFEIFDQYGSDALRFAMLSSNVAKGKEFLIDKDGRLVYDAMRLHLKPFWQAFHFFTLYANTDCIKAEIIYTSPIVIDAYILSKLSVCIQIIEKSLNAFDSQSAVGAFISFIEVLNNWYIRRSRERFWQNEINDTKMLAYNTLYTCLFNVTIAISPILPMISEEIYLGLSSEKVSVHLENFPDFSCFKFDADLVNSMDYVRDVCSAALFIRNENNIRIRQPLSSLSIIAKDAYQLQDLTYLINEEINVKSVKLLTDIDVYANKKLKLNFKVLALRLPDKMKQLIKDAKNWAIKGENIYLGEEKLLQGEYDLVLEPVNEKNTFSLDSRQALVLLDLEVNEDLYSEGLARDIIRHVQQYRKDMNLIVSEHILINFQFTDAKIQKVLSDYKTLITEQTLSEFTEELLSGKYFECKIQDHFIKICILRK